MRARRASTSSACSAPSAQSAEHTITTGKSVAGTIRGTNRWGWNDACPKSKLQEMKKALRHFRDNVDRMHYDEYIRDGLFIGSGPVESGCKTVIGARLKQSGMFWSLRGAKGMLPLRTLEKSGRLEEFFNYRIRNLRQILWTAA